MYIKKINKVIIMCLILCFVFTVKGNAGLDESVRDFVRRTDEGFLDDSMSFISSTGDRDVILTGLAIMPNGDFRTDLIMALAAGQLVTESVKWTTGRTRPRTGKNEFKPFSGHMSFPSGHATGAFSIATVIADYYPEYKVYAYIWAGLVAVSRMYEDAHWFTDVAVGSAVGHFTARKTLGLNWSWEW